MNKLIRPLSEEFLYCSPETLEKRLYQLMVPGAQEPPKPTAGLTPKEKCHVVRKRH